MSNTSADHYHFVRLRSTAGWVKENAHKLSKDSYSVVWTDEQTAGYGRQGRTWLSSPNENVAMTICYFSEAVPEGLPIAVVVGVARALNTLGFDCDIKWPNDLQICGKKLGGVLCETFSVDNAICISVSVGLNVNMPQHKLEMLDQPATSLVAESGGEQDLKRFTHVLKNELCLTLTQLHNNGLAPFMESYHKHLMHKQGDGIQFHHHNAIVKGVFEKIDDRGTLHLVVDGVLAQFRSGEIIV